MQMQNFNAHSGVPCRFVRRVEPVSTTEREAAHGCLDIHRNRELLSHRDTRSTLHHSIKRLAQNCNKKVQQDDDNDKRKEGEDDKTE